MTEVWLHSSSVLCSVTMFSLVLFLPSVTASLTSLLTQCTPLLSPDPRLMTGPDLQDMMSRNRGVRWDLVFKDQGGGTPAECSDPPTVLSMSYCEHTILKGEVEVYHARICSEQCPQVSPCYQMSSVPAWHPSSRWPQRKRRAPSVGFDWVVARDLVLGTRMDRVLLKHLFKPVHPRRGIVLLWSEPSPWAEAVVRMLNESEAVHPRLYWRDVTSEAGLLSRNVTTVVVFRRHPHAMLWNT